MIIDHLYLVHCNYLAVKNAKNFYATQMHPPQGIIARITDHTEHSLMELHSTGSLVKINLVKCHMKYEYI